MRKEINADFIMVHLLRIKESITIGELVRMKEKIEKLYPDLFVDITKTSIFSTISIFPDIFSWNDKDEIVKSIHGEHFYDSPYIELFDRHDMDSDTRANILNIINN